MAEEKELKSFEDLGVNPPLVRACDAVGWKNPTKIQVEAIPAALQGKDIIVIAPTGPGKTGAFAIPILQAFLKVKSPHPFFACVLSPTRELAVQVADQLKALGGPSFGIRCALLVEGGADDDDFAQQSNALRWDPHVVVATPARLVDHLCNTNVFSLRRLKFLVLDEADRLLDDHFELVEEILNVTPPRLRTHMFCATMTKNVKRLRRGWLKDPVMVEAASKKNPRMKNKKGGRKKRRKCEEDDLRRSRPMTELGKKLKDKLEEISLCASPKKRRVEVDESGTCSYELVYRNGRTLSVCVANDDESGEEEEGPSEWSARTLPGHRPSAEFPPSLYPSSYVEPPIIRPY